LYDKSFDFEVPDVSFSAGEMAANSMCENHKEIDGVFAVTDLIAIGALGAFREHEIAVPGQVSVIGFSNWFLSQITTPHLSTVDQPGFEIGKTAFNLVYQEIQNKKNNIKAPSKTVVIPTTVISRESTN